MDDACIEMSAEAHEESNIVRDSNVLAHSIDRILEDSSVMAFFIHFLESCDKLNLVKFWIHVSGFKASFGNCPTGSSQKAEQSLALLDARNIYDRYIDKESSCSISLPKSISGRIQDRLQDDCIAPEIFDEAKSFVRDVFETRYLKDFKNSVYYKKHLLQVLSRGCNLDDVLHVPALLNSFLEFVDDQHDRDCIQFLLACNTFESSYDKLSDEELLEDAMCVYDRYLSMQALTSLLVGDNVRQIVESEICSDTGRPLRSSFLSAKQFCMLRLSEKYLRKFVGSPYYQSYLIELETEVQNTVELPVANREVLRAGSSSSESLPITFDRTFEAPDCKRTPAISAQHSPLLAKRNRTLNLAEVDCMGRYHVLYDDSLAQDSTAPSRLRQKLRKYLDKSTLKEEEVAVEVARTIIADVHNMVEAGRKCL
ncbi:regulator of G protein signaling domain protein [Ancylostoma duodenale]|uniref:Regulator of G protein signaling domain protein n=1 Tax=Ancylostoma duodenale TaxID=51022 RepID=A0A0C2DB18_9BILA|nr:regulator of G protein signaling domain protein [Ancylostoma duodenale]